jgi:hypothetical protein
MHQSLQLILEIKLENPPYYVESGILYNKVILNSMR